MTISVLERMTAEIDQLSFADQLLLIERLAQRIRRASLQESHAVDELSLMANDPDIQREMQLIHAEFAVTEQDILNLLPPAFSLQPPA